MHFFEFVLYHGEKTLDHQMFYNDMEVSWTRGTPRMIFFTSDFPLQINHPAIGVPPLMETWSSPPQQESDLRGAEWRAGSAGELGQSWDPEIAAKWINMCGPGLKFWYGCQLWDWLRVVFRLPVGPLVQCWGNNSSRSEAIQAGLGP